MLPVAGMGGDRMPDQRSQLAVSSVRPKSGLWCGFSSVLTFVHPNSFSYLMHIDFSRFLVIWKKEEIILSKHITTFKMDR